MSLLLPDAMRTLIIAFAFFWLLPLTVTQQSNSTPDLNASDLGKSAAEAGSYQSKLMNTLLSDYDRTLRPVQFISTTTNVTLNPALYTILDTNEAMETIGLVLWLRMVWKDELLTWDPNDYDGIDKLQIPMFKIWYPDIAVLNMIDLKSMTTDDRNLAYVAFDGTIRASVGQIATIHCNYKIINFPFDVQNCTLHILSWTLTADEMNLFPTYPPDLEPYKEHAEWDLIAFSPRRTLTIYGNLSAPFVDVYYDILIQRKPGYYLTTFVLPSFIVTTLAVVGIFSPFTDTGGREEKVTMGLTTLLNMSVILLIVTEQMPKSSEGVPLLGLYIMFQIALSASASCISVLLMYQHIKWTAGHPVPNWLLKITRLTERETARRKKWDKTQKKEEEVDEKKNPTFLGDMHYILIRIMKAQMKETLKEELRLIWNRALRRLEFILMIFYIVLNTLSTLAITLYGYANLVV